MNSCRRQKSEARKHYAAMRQQARQMATPEQWGPLQKHNILKWWSTLYPQFNGRICSYFPIKDELTLLPSHGEGKWYFPKIVGADLHWFAWGAEEPLPEKGLHGIPTAPAARPATAVFTNPTLVFTPALAVDPKGYRLGYGGGYYDRLFAHEGLRTLSVVIVVVPETCREATFPVEEHDIQCDVVVTENQIQTLTPCDQLLKRLVTNKG